jgi:erythronate-4-phosphate dehydrogenase
MNIVADANIPFAVQAFSCFGNVRVAPGRAIDKAMVADADMLLVRSVTRVDRNLLENSHVRFVGTATIGIDHVDTGYLAAQGIAFASAPGSNAQSVAEYVACSLVHVYHGDLTELSGKTLGVIGAGNVGSRVLKIGQSLGMRCLVNDPPLAQASSGKGFSSLEEIQSEADIITLHVPFTNAGLYPTLSLVDETFIKNMKPSSMLINTSRGRVVDEKALISLRNRLGAVVLDVWENEPAIDFKTLALADISTPHIAGYSYDGKVRGARMLFEAAAAFLKSRARWSDSVLETEITGQSIDIREAQRPLAFALETAYPIMADDAQLRKILNQENPAAYFDELRKQYPKRLEFEHFSVCCSRQQEEAMGPTLKKLGFTVRREE